MRKGSLLKVSLKVNTECIRFTSLAILIIALLPADIKGHCPLVKIADVVVSGKAYPVGNHNTLSPCSRPILIKNCWMLDDAGRSRSRSRQSWVSILMNLRHLLYF